MRTISVREYCLLLCLFAAIATPARGIDCYRCNNTSGKHQFQCNEFLTNDIDMVPEPCDDVFGAQYCVKHVGRYEALALRCYQCTSATEWTCGESFLTEEAQQPESCDHVFDAQYCIKTTGRYGGGIGTKRYCSSVHMGNFCEYVKQVGDTLEYRTCVYTCSSDGCNPATRASTSVGVIFFVSISTIIYFFRR
ncbi:uncharacterized protein bou isoform X2 [Fopius arisanus]|uniref:Uncharacterized protein bou isoform X2 n=1 Tax=Fopius arisanus TaxID=64838 RepID=A0A9R1T5X9_9HYME|nr:PREDICTED: uncharacterized protein LOC105266738 isoform X2 [Fopius arisanus]